MSVLLIRIPLNMANNSNVLDKRTFTSTPAGRMMGLNERECGQTGVTKIAATLG